MQISEISFADKVAYNIKADDTKKYILDNLDKRYNLKIISKHHDRFEEKLMHSINNNPHLICAKSNGNPYFLHMLKYNFKNYCVFIDKKIQQGYYYPRMIICNFHFSDSLFDDTVIEGEMVKTNSGRWLFVMNDLLVVKGSYLNESNVIKRLNILYEVMENDFTIDDMDICRFSVKKYFKYHEYDELINDHIPKLPYTCRGIYFKPLFLRFKDILVNFDDSVVKKVERKKYKNTSNFLLNDPESQPEPEPQHRHTPREAPPQHQLREAPTREAPPQHQLREAPPPPPREAPPQHQLREAVPREAPPHQTRESFDLSQKIRPFNIRKTSNPDIYEIFELSTNTMAGVACIPTMKVSKYMRNIFENKNVVDKVEIRCEYSEKFKKWIPLVLY